MGSYAIVFLGAGIGGALRHGTNVATARLFGSNFPFGTLSVNVLGSLLMAVIMEVFALKAGLPQSARLFLTTGVLGGYTTFSTFTLDAMSMVERGQWPMAAFYMAVSVAGSLVAFFIGMMLVRQLLAG